MVEMHLKAILWLACLSPSVEQGCGCTLVAELLVLIHVIKCVGELSRLDLDSLNQETKPANYYLYRS